MEWYLQVFTLHRELRWAISVQKDLTDIQDSHYSINKDLTVLGHLKVSMYWITQSVWTRTSWDFWLRRHSVKMQLLFRVSPNLRFYKKISLVHLTHLKKLFWSKVSITKSWLPSEHSKVRIIRWVTHLKLCIASSKVSNIHRTISIKQWPYK